MPTLVYRISTLLSKLLNDVHQGTNLGLFCLLWTLLSGRLLTSRGALFPALTDFGLDKAAVYRSEAALAYGQWKIASLLANWQQIVTEEGQFQPHSHGGIRPVPVDITAFYRAHLSGCVSKHYTSQAGKALPAIVLGLVARVGSVSGKRLCLPRHILRLTQGERERDFAKRLLSEAASSLQKDEALIVDAGFSLVDVLGIPGIRFVLRGAINFTARQNQLLTQPPPGLPGSRVQQKEPLIGL